MLEQRFPKVTTAYDMFILDRKAQRFKSKTLKTYHDRLFPFINWCATTDFPHVNQLNSTVIRTYILSQQERNLAAHTVHGIAICIQTFCNWLVTEELVTESPMKRVKIPKTDKKILPAVSNEDIQKLLKGAKNDRDRAMILFLLDTGIRAMEFVNLVGENIDLKTGAVEIQLGKGGKNRTVYIGNRTRKQLLKYYLYRGIPEAKDKIWLNERTGKPLTDAGLRQWLKKLSKRIGVKDCSPHALRRTFAIESMRKGANIYVLARLMGHTDIEVLRQYLDLVQNDLRASSEKYGIVDNM